MTIRIVIRVIASAILALVAIAVPFGNAYITPAGKLVFDSSIAYAGPGTPVTVYDGASADLSRYETQRKVFQNPRGLGYYYCFYFNGTTLQYAYSQDGISWTNEQSIFTVDCVHGSVWVYDDGAQLVVYAVGNTIVSDEKDDAYYRQGTIADAASTITWGTEVEFRDEGQHFITITRADDGYIWLVLE